eukprot:scaffold1513_cov164-Pinguiococcus_pyrenoidosus.AAC.4
MGEGGHGDRRVIRRGGGDNWRELATLYRVICAVAETGHQPVGQTAQDDANDHPGAAPAAAPVATTAAATSAGGRRRGRARTDVGQAGRRSDDGHVLADEKIRGKIQRRLRATPPGYHIRFKVLEIHLVDSQGCQRYL